MTQLVEQDQASLPRRSVTRAEFRAAAIRAGWSEPAIDAFLKLVFPAMKDRKFQRQSFGRLATKVGKEVLRVTDWV